MQQKYDFKMVFPNIQVEGHEDKNHKTFILEPLENGFGITIGNVLRRIALSSLPGGAVKKINIKDVNHEYDVIPGVVEDVTSVILSLKELYFRIDAQDEEYVLTLKANKKGEIFAKDIECPAGVEIMNPDKKIVTLSEDTDFEMDITLSKGRGYKLAEENRGKEKKSQDIYIDSIYTPVSKFAYKVEDTRVGDKTNYDKLVLDIWTNGMLTPEEVLSYSAHILNEHILLIKDLEETIKLSNVFNKVEEVPVEEVTVVEEYTSIEALDISNRAYNGLKKANINTIEELVQKNKKEIGTLDNIGAKTIDEIEQQLEDLGFKFKED